jgi:DNA replication protein DnaC
MEAIKKLLPKAVGTLARPTKANPRSTKVWAKFADFETLGDPQLERMKDEAVSFIDDLFNDRTPRWLSLLGTSGAGKTMLASRVARLFREHRADKIDWPRTEGTRTSARPHGRIVRWKGGFINWGEAINDRMLRAGDYAFLDDMRSYDLFVIDDILSEYEKHRSLSASKLYFVLEGRLRRWTVITANVSLRQIGELLDHRIASRMLRGGGVVVDVDVPDYNVRAKR